MAEHETVTLGARRKYARRNRITTIYARIVIQSHLDTTTYYYYYYYYNHIETTVIRQRRFTL